MYCHWISDEQTKYFDIWKQANDRSKRITHFFINLLIPCYIFTSVTLSGVNILLNYLIYGAINVQALNVPYKGMYGFVNFLFHIAEIKMKRFIDKFFQNFQFTMESIWFILWIFFCHVSSCFFNWMLFLCKLCIFNIIHCFFHSSGSILSTILFNGYWA